jgi:hypothetical protein
MYADTVSERLSAVIPGYDELPRNENGDEAAFVARYEAAIELANLVQTGLVIDATENDGWSPQQVTEDELNALFQSKVVPFVPCEGADGRVSAEWRVDVPLVVSATSPPSWVATGTPSTTPLSPTAKHSSKPTPTGSAPSRRWGWTRRCSSAWAGSAPSSGVLRSSTSADRGIPPS